MGVVFIDELPSANVIDTTFDVVVDALFGFSFKGAPRPPFDTVLATLSEITRPLVSVDIPSGMCPINTLNILLCKSYPCIALHAFTVCPYLVGVT